MIENMTDLTAQAALRELGVRRVTFGPFLMRELAPELAELTAPWR